MSEPVSERGWQNPSTTAGEHADPAADGRPTPGEQREWSDQAPGAPEWAKADNEERRAGDRDRELDATGDGQHPATGDPVAGSTDH